MMREIPARMHGHCGAGISCSSVGTSSKCMGKFERPLEKGKHLYFISSSCRKVRESAVYRSLLC
ncbi:hypothetical protein X975_20249, partial [Stegodyphus mimosarum]